MEGMEHYAPPPPDVQAQYPYQYNDAAPPPPDVMMGGPGPEAYPPPPDGAADGQQPGSMQQQDYDNGAGEAPAPDAAAAPLPPPPPPAMTARRHKWGPPMDEGKTEGGDEAGERKKKRRSRWEESDKPCTAIVVAAPAGSVIGSFTFPKEVTLSGGIKVRAARSVRHCKGLRAGWTPVWGAEALCRLFERFLRAGVGQQRSCWGLVCAGDTAQLADRRAVSCRPQD